MPICNECGCEIDGEEYDYNGRTLCEECADRLDICTCNDCGRNFSMTDDGGAYLDGDAVCQECLNQNYYICDKCHNWESQEERYSTIYGTTVCYSCAEELYCCDRCGLYGESGDGIIVDEDGDAYCETCMEREGIVLCEECNYFAHDVVDGVCGDCRREREESGEGMGAIHSYNYRPKYKLYKDKDEKPPLPYFGVEVEAENMGPHNNESLAEHLINTFPGMFCKGDGSLSHGFELVSHPMSLKFHLEKAQWPDIMYYMVRNGMRAHDTTTCGLHIHVSRDFFKPLDLIKLGVFYNSNQMYIERFARRSAERWAKFMGKRGGKMKNLPASSDKYEAVNYQHSGSIEIRVFKGTLNPTTFLASIEFVDATSRYIKERGLGFLENGAASLWRDFTTYCLTNRYQHLPGYLERRKLILPASKAA